MELKIVSCNNFYKLKGALNATNVQHFETEIYDALTQYSKVTVSVNDLQLIDSKAVNCLSDAFFHAKDLGKELIILGNGCKELYEHFESSQAA